MRIDKKERMSSIQAGEDTGLELKEIVFRGDRVSFAREEGRAASRLAEVFVSMANTKGGEVVMGVRDSDRVPVGIDPEKRDLLEQFVTNVALNNCKPMIVPSLNWSTCPEKTTYRSSVSSSKSPCPGSTYTRPATGAFYNDWEATGNPSLPSGWHAC